MKKLLTEWRKYLKEQPDEVGTISALISPAGTDFVVTTGEGRVVAIEQLRDINDPRMQKMAIQRGFEIDRPLTDFSYDTVEIIAQGTGELPQEGAAMRKIRAWMKGSGIREAISLDREEAYAILSKAQDIGFIGVGGQCGGAAIAMNDVVFEGHGKIIAAVNKYLWETENRVAGHVALELPDGEIWDAEGPLPLEDFEAFGMLDVEDPDYNLPNEQAAEEVIIIRPTEQEISSLFGECDVSLGKRINILKQASGKLK